MKTQEQMVELAIAIKGCLAFDPDRKRIRAGGFISDGAWAVRETPTLIERLDQEFRDTSEAVSVATDITLAQVPPNTEINRCRLLSTRPATLPTGMVRRRCFQCGGRGKIDCECLECGNSHEAVCSRCDGAGWLEDTRPADAGHAFYERPGGEVVLLNEMYARLLHGLEVLWDGDERGIVYGTQDGEVEVIVMSMGSRSRYYQTEMEKVKAALRVLSGMR